MLAWKFHHLCNLLFAALIDYVFNIVRLTHSRIYSRECGRKLTPILLHLQQRHETNM